MIESDQAPKYQILLAEDDEVNQDIVRAFLGSATDLDLTVVTDGRLALEAALVNKYDLMILDQQMPHMTGDRVLLHLRAGRSLNATTPIIRFTAAADAKPVDIRRVNGVAEATLPKPLRKETLLSTVRAMLGPAL
jgi:CheY-like chemotaxis protein